MASLYQFKTRIGPFFIAEKDGRYHVLFENDSLGSYATPAQAADDLSGGHTDSVQSGIDTSTLGISDDIADWDRL